MRASSAPTSSREEIGKLSLPLDASIAVDRDERDGIPLCMVLLQTLIGIAVVVSIEICAETGNRSLAAGKLPVDEIIVGQDGRVARRRSLCDGDIIYYIIVELRHSDGKVERGIYTTVCCERVNGGLKQSVGSRIGIYETGGEKAESADTKI